MTGLNDPAVGKLACRLCGAIVFRTFDPNHIRVIQCKECGGFKMKVVLMCKNDEDSENK